MKKILVILTVVLTACLSQAAAVTWNSGSLKAPLPDGTFSGTSITTAANTPLMTILFFTSLVDAQNNENAMVVTGVTSDNTASLGALSGTTGNNFAATTTYWTKAVVTITTDAGAKQWTMISGIGSFATPDTGDQNINFLTGANMGGVRVWPGATSATWAVVPEPTSMALLALGVAAVGLRRRFKK